mmetsp:Transcript_26763/g.79480  ORF Transcript_26763/g.79480 Transcript_26763/m.79480 type:complete len:403 (-) Transcript_26763:79-1287(-)
MHCKRAWPGRARRCGNACAHAYMHACTHARFLAHLQLLQSYTLAQDTQKTQAKHLCMVAIEKSPEVFISDQWPASATIIDMHSCLSTASTQLAPGIQGSVSSLDELESLLLHQQPACSGENISTSCTSTIMPCAVPSRAIFIDSISQILLQYPPQRVLAFLSRLQRQPSTSCILTMIHRDLHDEHVLSGVEYLTTCGVQLQPLTQLHREIAARQLGQGEPNGCITFRYKRRAGRVHAESLLYTLMSDGKIQLVAPPVTLAGSITAEALVALSLGKTDATSSQLHAASTIAHGTSDFVHADAVASKGTSAPLPGGGMRLELNDQERAAKEHVRLPYEHQGDAARYQTGQWKDYLPVSAGGMAGAQHHSDHAAAEVTKLGHILYVRDSEEEHDSDEDPDDDLDI